MNFGCTQLIIDLDAIRHNINEVKTRAGVPVMAIIKADAYGHGAVEIARHLSGDCAFSVSAPCWRRWSFGKQIFKNPF